MADDQPLSQDELAFAIECAERPIQVFLENPDIVDGLLGQLEDPAVRNGPIPIADEFIELLKGIQAGQRDALAHGGGTVRVAMVDEAGVQVYEAEIGRD
jgi:hypothetical protein